MNKLIHLIIAIVLNINVAFAGTMGEVTCEGEVTMPCAVNGWDFTIAALYLKTAYSDDFLQPFATQTGFQELSTLWGWGFVLGGSFHWDLGRDIKLNWYHYGKTTERAIFAAIEAEVEPLLYQTEFRPKWDAVNIEFGQTMVLGPLTHMRFHMGGQYTRISHDFYVNDGTLPQPDAVHSSMNGFGGRFGVEMHRNFTNAISLYIENAGAVLVGKPEFHTYTNGILDVPGLTSFNKIQVVPELEGKIGGRIKFELAQGDFNFDLGYMVNKYFEAQIFRTITSDTSIINFALLGPYLRFNYIGYT